MNGLNKYDLKIDYDFEIEVKSMKKGGECLTRPDILQKRIEAGTDVESTIIIPLKD